MRQLKPWTDDQQRREETLAAAVRLVEIARQETSLPEDLRKFLVNKAIWYWTEDRTPSRKFLLRYRSLAALNLQKSLGLTAAARQLAHEHVHERRHVITTLLQPNADIVATISACAGCVVTRVEHNALSKLDASHRGWDRYRASALDVIDMSTGKTADLDMLVKQDSQVQAETSKPVL